MTPLESQPFSVRQLDLNARYLSIISPDFDFDSFGSVASQLLQTLDATVIEKECSADLHIWLVDFEGCRLLLKGEHYSSTLWLEAMSEDDLDTLAFIAGLLN